MLRVAVSRGGAGVRAAATRQWQPQRVQHLWSVRRALINASFAYERTDTHL